jgi:hypothetical protein
VSAAGDRLGARYRRGPPTREELIAEFRQELPRLLAEEAACYDCTCNRIAGLGPCKKHRFERKLLAS